MKTINVYKFEELSKEVQNSIIEKNRYNKLFMDFFTEDANEQIKEAGFINPELQYSLGCSQGDGLSFSASDYTGLYDLVLECLGKGKEKTAALLCDYISIEIKGNTYRYCYAAKGQVDLYYDYPNNIYSTYNIDKLISKVLNEFEYIYMNLCNKLEAQGYAEIEHQQSDEYIKEDLINIDFDYTKEGVQI